MDPARLKSAFLELTDLFAIQTVPGILRCWERNRSITLDQKTTKEVRPTTSWKKVAVQQDTIVLFYRTVVLRTSLTARLWKQGETQRQAPD